MGSMVKRFSALTLVVLLASAASAAAQQAYPSKPIRFVTPYAPGGTTSVIARLLGQKLTENLGQPVLVDNRGGAGTMLGTDIVAKAQPDGYTILLAGGSLVLVPLVYKAPYDPITDLAPVATIAATEFVLLLHGGIPASNLKEFIAYAKARPGALNYATPGAGGSQHLAHELLNLLAGISTHHIPYKGSGPALTDLLGGQVQLYFSTAVTAIPHINSGRLKAVAITGEKRLPVLPNVPTFEQAGLSGFFRIGGYFGIVAPARTPRPIVQKLAAELAKYHAQPDFHDTLLKQGLTPYAAGPEKYVELLKAGLADNAAILKKVNLKLEN